MDNSEIATYIEAIRSEDNDVRFRAYYALAKIGAPALPTLFELLKDKESRVRHIAALAIAIIEPASADSVIPVLRKGLRDEIYDVRLLTAEALGNIGDSSAVISLVGALRNEPGNVSLYASRALSKIGSPIAVPALIQALTDTDSQIRYNAAKALEGIGNAEILPRKILAQPSLTPQQRIDRLNELRKVRYRDKGINLIYKFPNTRTLCQTVLMENNDASRIGAQAVLDWLNGDRNLLHPSQRDITTEAQELLRAHESDTQETQPDTLLRASDEPNANTETPVSQPTFWQRLFMGRID